MLVNPFDFEFQVDPRVSSCNITNAALQRYSAILFDRRCPGDHKSLVRPNVAGSERNDVLRRLEVSFQDCQEFPYEEMDESYRIRIEGQASSLMAVSSWGVIRGLETFSQLLMPAANGTALDGMFLVRQTDIFDFPRFPFRGIMIDTARHFIPVSVLKQNLDAMAANKMNVFHWHLVDDQSFPYESIRFPELQQKGAYNARTHVFTQNDVRDVIEYARVRGIRVIPEFDTPGHTLSWRAIPRLLTPCYESSRPTGKLGPINPILNSSYAFLARFLQEIADVFPDTDVHVGGDEVDFSCWESNPDIAAYMQAHGITQGYQLQQLFMERMMRLTDSVKKRHIVWQEVFDKGSLLSNRSTVHVWLGDWVHEWRSKLKEITDQGIRVILSSPWYLNHIKYGIDWEPFYEVEPRGFAASERQKNLVLGGSVCMWSEFVDGAEIIARTWPRASAVAERLWSSGDVRDIQAAAPRIQRMQCLMQQRGLRVGAIHGPAFCACDHAFL